MQDLFYSKVGKLAQESIEKARKRMAREDYIYHYRGNLLLIIIINLRTT